MKQKIKEISNNFVKELGKFIEKQREKAERQGITEKEFLAIASTTFNLLGRNTEYFKKEAKIK